MEAMPAICRNNHFANIARLLLMLLLIGIADYVTGLRLEFFVFYFIPVALAGWQRGRFCAVLLSIMSAIVWFSADFFLRYPNVHWLLAWDTGVRLASFLVIGMFATRTRELVDKGKVLSAEQRELIAKLDVSNKRLVEKASELDAFSSAVAHDLKNHLQTVKSCGEILVDSCRPKMEKIDQETLDFMVAASKRMEHIVTDLLALSRIAQQELHRQSVNLSAIARKIFEDLKKFDPNRSVEFIVTEEFHADMDPGLARILLENLISNAWKFSSKKERALIELGARKEEGSVIYFIRDNGAGFDMAHVDRLFIPFQRLHSQKEFRGTGIGLATVKRIAEKHGGAVRAESEPQKGATFFFRVS